jgi:hypothetical protein
MHTGVHVAFVLNATGFMHTDLWIRRFAADAAANTAEFGWGAKPAAAALAILANMS